MKRKGELVFSGCRRREKDTGKFATVPKEKPPTFFNVPCIVFAGVMCSGLAFFAYFLHSRTVHRRAARQEEIRHPKHVPNEYLMEEYNHPRLLNTRIKTTRIFSDLSDQESSSMNAEAYAELHEHCNPSLTPTELSTVDMEAALLAPKDQCGQNEAQQLRKALDAVAYSYAAVVPEPYMHPPMMEQVFRVLGHSELVQAISHLSERLHVNLKSRELAVLVQFFAWGWPVDSGDLRKALGDTALVALQQCQLVMPCSKVPSHWISSLMVYPVPHTSAVVATDWGTRYRNHSQSIPVSTVSEATIGLMQNSPDVRDKRVLDMSFNGGVQAIVAAERGAGAAVVLEPSVRSARIARFNTWLNGVESKVWVGTLDDGAKLSPLADSSNKKFDVILGKGDEKGLEKTFGIADHFLVPHGSFAMVVNFTEHELNPEKFANHLGMVLPSPGFSGKVVYDMQAPFSPTEGLVFGSKNADNHVLGGFSVVALNKSPMSYAYGNTKDRACYWSNLGCPLN